MESNTPASRGFGSRPSTPEARPHHQSCPFIHPPRLNAPQRPQRSASMRQVPWSRFALPSEFFQRVPATAHARRSIATFPPASNSVAASALIPRLNLPSHSAGDNSGVRLRAQFAKLFQQSRLPVQNVPPARPAARQLRSMLLPRFCERKLGIERDVEGRRCPTQPKRLPDLVRARNASIIGCLKSPSNPLRGRYAAPPHPHLPPRAQRRRELSITAAA